MIKINLLKEEKDTTKRPYYSNNNSEITFDSKPVERPDFGYLASKDDKIVFDNNKPIKRLDYNDLSNNGFRVIWENNLGIWGKIVDEPDKIPKEKKELLEKIADKLNRDYKFTKLE